MVVDNAKPDYDESLAETESTTVKCDYSAGFRTNTGGTPFTVTCEHNGTHTYLGNVQQCSGKFHPAQS